jgi:hypothetical protein
MVSLCVASEDCASQQEESVMSYKSGLSRKARVAALSLGIALLSAPAFAQNVDQSDYYASIGNPHPELPGFPKIRRSDNRIYANVFDPRPEITTPRAGVFATTGSGASYRPSTSQAAVPQPQSQAR